MIRRWLLVRTYRRHRRHLSNGLAAYREYRQHTNSTSGTGLIGFHASLVDSRGRITSPVTEGTPDESDDARRLRC